MWPFQFPTLWDEDCNRYSYMISCSFEYSFSSLHFGMKTAIIQGWWNRISSIFSFSSLHFGMKTAISNSFESGKSLFSLSVPYTLGWRLQSATALNQARAYLAFQFPTLWDEDCNEDCGNKKEKDWASLSVPYTLGWRLQFQHPT